MNERPDHRPIHPEWCDCRRCRQLRSGPGRRNWTLLLTLVGAALGWLAIAAFVAFRFGAELQELVR